MQAALGRVALTKVPRWVEIRRRHANRLTKTLSDLPGLRVPAPPDSVYHAYYKYYAFLRPETLRDGWDRNAILRAIKAEGVPCFAGSCSEIYREKAFAARRERRRLPMAKLLGETGLMFLVHPTLSEEDIAFACRAIQGVMARAVKSSTVSAGSRLAAANPCG